MSRSKIHPSSASSEERSPSKEKTSVVSVQPSAKSSKSSASRQSTKSGTVSASASTISARSTVKVNPYLEQTLNGHQQLFIKHVFAPEAVLHLEHRYDIQNKAGDRVLQASSNCEDALHGCFGSCSSPFQLSVYKPNPHGERKGSKQNKEKLTEVMNIEGNSGFLPGSTGNIKVMGGEKEVGSVEQIWDWSKPHYCVLNTKGKEVLQIEGPEMTMCCISLVNPNYMKGRIEYRILNAEDGLQVGKISKEGDGTVKQFSAKDITWALKYSPDATLDSKMLLLAAVFLIDYQFLGG